MKKRITKRELQKAGLKFNEDIEWLLMDINDGTIDDPWFTFPFHSTEKVRAMSEVIYALAVSYAMQQDAFSFSDDFGMVKCSEATWYISSKIGASSFYILRHLRGMTCNPYYSHRLIVDKNFGLDHLSVKRLK